MIKPFSIEVDFKLKKQIKEPVVTQFDDVIFTITVFDNATPAELDGTYKLVSHRVDGKNFYVDGVKTGTNVITFDLGKSEVELIGKVTSLVQLFDVNNQRTSSFPFTFSVVSDLSLDEQPTSTERSLLEIVIQDGPGLVEFIKEKQPLIEQFTNDQTNLQTQINSANEQLAETATKTQAVNTAKATGTLNPYQTLLSESFKDLLDYVSLNTDGTTGDAWTLSNGIVSSPNGLKDALLINNKVKFVDGIISVLWENPNSDNPSTSWAGIVFRGKTDSDLLAVIIFENNQNIGLWKITDGATVNITSASLDNPSVHASTGNKVLLQVQVAGNNVKVTANGQKMLDYSGAELIDYKGGKCGLVTSVNGVKQFSSFSIVEKRYDIIHNNITNVLMMGTSITNGIGTTAGNGWVDQLRTKLKNEFVVNPDTLDVGNAGIPGDTTAQILARLIPSLNDDQRDVVIIEGGTNDSRIDLSISHNTAIANIREMIKRIKATGAIPLVCICTPIDYFVATNHPEYASSYNSTSFIYLVKLNSMIRNLCAEEKVRVIDNFIAFNNQNLLSDGIHPNDTGAGIMATTAFNVFVNKF